MKQHWQHVDASVEGASHKLSGKPNQDRILFYSKSENDSQFPIIMAIADGHGGEKYFRSDKGAELAVTTAIEVCKGLEQIPWDVIKERKNISLLCREIVLKWLEKVNTDLQINPISENEWNPQNSKRDLIVKRPEAFTTNAASSAYGTTLLITAIYPSGILYIQIGDGDILVFDHKGDLEKPIPDDDRLIGNETTSLCQPEAWLDFRTQSITIDEKTQFPALVLMSSDGYKNSYTEERIFDNIGLDMLKLICECPRGIEVGIDYIDQNLVSWLNKTSEKGSGDDISVGIICNIPQIEKYRDTPHNNVSITKSTERPEAENSPENEITPQTPEMSPGSEDPLTEKIETTSEPTEQIIDCIK